MWLHSLAHHLMLKLIALTSAKIHDLRKVAFHQHLKKYDSSFIFQSPPTTLSIDGEKMASTAPFYTYKETRLNLDPAPSTTISINLPTHTSTLLQHSKRPSTSLADLPPSEDEPQFRQRHLATSASIYHRQHHAAPRSILWRVLEDGHVLTLTTVDISRQASSPDTPLTLRLVFRDAIKPHCIAFADSPDHDVLSAFVLTESNVLYTLSLRPDFWRKAAASENVVDWCRMHESSAYSFKRPWRMVALGADELLCGTSDGGLLRLGRKSGGDGSEWKETHYNEGGFRQNLRSLMPFQGSNAVKYGKTSLELPTATSIASPSTKINGTAYTFMVSLDHKLRIWNLQTGRLVYIGDILNQEEPAEAAKPVIDPSYSQLIKVYGDSDAGEDGGDIGLCVTYSPLGTGQFKFWNISSAAEGNLEVTDLFPSNILEPQTPTSDLWTLADFSVVLDRSNIDSYTLWVLWKNNITYRVQKLQFQSATTSRVHNAWTNGWEAMATETLRDAALPAILPSDHSDVTDKWLEYITAPGRFTAATIDTGLSIYERGLGSKDIARRSGPLEERMCLTIASLVSLGRTSDSNMEYEPFRIATDTQWRRFYRLLCELDKQRGEALSLIIDPQGEMPWVVLADGITAIRECSGLERIWHNQDAVQPGTEHVAALVTAAAALRDTFSEQMTHTCHTALLEELFEEPSLIDTARMRVFYDKCDLANQIGDEEYAQLQNNLGGGFKDVTPQVYGALLDLMSASEDVDKRSQLLPNAKFGNKLILKGVQETVELHRTACLDQLVLLILIEAEINHGEEGIGFETADVFRQLVIMLKRLELINWLTKKQISLPLPKERSASISASDKSLNKKAPPTTEKVTVMEGVLRHLFGFDPQKDESMPQALTELIIQICAPESEYETPAPVTQCFLLKHDRADLAMEFSRFSELHPFDIYVQGRTCLVCNDAFAASMLFKKAAFGIGKFDRFSLEACD